MSDVALHRRSPREMDAGDPRSAARTGLVTLGSAAPAMQALSRMRFWRLCGASRIRDEVPARVPAEIVQGLLVARHDLAFLLRAEGDAVRLGLGSANEQQAEALARAVSTSLGGPEPSSAAGDFSCLALPAVGCLTGIPRAAEAESSRGKDIPLADLLLDTFADRSFGLAVLASPASGEEMRDRLEALREEAERLDRDYLAMPQQADVHRPARRRREWLDAMIERLERGLAHGMWRTWALLASESQDRTLQALGLVAGSLADVAEGSLLPLRPALCGAQPPAPPPPPTLLDSRELASWLVLPKRDRSGFAVREETSFDVDHPERGEGIVLGSVLDGERPTRQLMRIPAVALTRHTFVGGHSGAGKTTLVQQILREVAIQRIPFLVLEPAKGEYRALVEEIEDLCVFSVGKLSAPREIGFQFNPFAFPEGFPLHTHIDLLKNAFTASFGFVPPAPYLLESALYRAYESVGWRLEMGEHPNGHDPLAFPTLSDLLGAVDPVIDAAGYDVEVSRNLRGALRTRIGNLCLGPKGMALDTRENVPNALLFERPLVLELRHLGSDTEKAFLMSLVLMRLYEVRESSGLPAGTERLRHLLIIEEAHRLLRRQAERSGEEGNMAHEAVRAFENLISEVRAYGQGVVLVDQLPSTISPGALKQTALRVLHRLIPREDREAVGDVLSDPQSRALAFLETGQAVVHAEGMDGAIRIRTPRPARTGSSERAEVLVADRIREALNSDDRDRLTGTSRRAPHARTLANREVRGLADGLVAAAVAGRPLGRALESLELCLARVARVGDGDPRDALALLTEFAIDDALLRRALHYGWSRDRLARIQSLARSGVPVVAEGLRKELELPAGPHPWCGACPEPCRWGYEGSLLARDAEVLQAAGAIAGKSQSDWIAGLVDAVTRAARSVLPGSGSIPAVFSACTTGFALDSHGVRSGEVEAVLRLILESQKEGEHD